MPAQPQHTRAQLARIIEERRRRGCHGDRSQRIPETRIGKKIERESGGEGPRRLRRCTRMCVSPGEVVPPAPPSHRPRVASDWALFFPIRVQPVFRYRLSPYTFISLSLSFSPGQPNLGKERKKERKDETHTHARTRESFISRHVREAGTVLVCLLGAQSVPACVCSRPRNLFHSHLFASENHVETSELNARAPRFEAGEVTADPRSTRR